MANDAFLKPSLFLETLAPQLEEESFINFLRAYYEWLQSTKLTFTGKVGTFTKGEIIVGDDSKSKAIIKEIGSNYLVLKPITEAPFELRETFEGQTSGAIARVVEVRDNVVRAAARNQKNRDPSVSSDKYFEYLKSEFNKGFPTVTEADRRLISNKLKDFYQSKSNEDAYRFLFRAIYGLDIEFRYPGEEVLRVSDGDFEKTILVRAVPTDNIFSYLNQTIVGQSSGALGNVVDIKITFLGGIRYAELILKLVSGTFTGGETIYLLDDPTETTTLYGMVSSTNIIDAGSGYEIGDVLTITGDGQEATAEVSSVSSGPINKIRVNTVGHGYRQGTQAIVNNSGTGGSGFAVKVDEITNTYTVTDGANTYTVGEVSKVSIVSRGSDYFKSPTITLDDIEVKALGLLSENLITIVSGGTNYAVGDTLVFAGGAGANTSGIVASVGNTSSYGTENLLFEDGTAVLQDNTVNGRSSVLKNEDWTNSGSILRVELINLGTGYTAASLPSISVTSGTGSSANLIATGIQGDSANVQVDVANNAVGLGAIRSIELKNFGIDYTTATIDATGAGDGNANVLAVISGISVTDGVFLTDDGKISVKILQDSLFYQDFSYVIRSGLVFNAYKELVKQSIHPAGLQFFGEILISSYILASAQFNSVVSVEREEMEVIIKQVLSFFPGTINPIEVELEKNLELEIDVSSPGNAMEMNVEIAPAVIPVSYEQAFGETSIDLEILVDLTMQFYSEVVITDSVRTIEVDIITELPSTVSFDRREINVEIAPLKIQTDANFLPTRNFDRYIEKDIDLAIDTPISERVIKITSETLAGEIPFYARPEYSLVNPEDWEDITFDSYIGAPSIFATARILGEDLRTDGPNQNKIDIKIKSQANETLGYQSSSSRFDRIVELYVDATMAFYTLVQSEGTASKTEIDIIFSVSTVSSEDRQIDIDIVPGVMYVGHSTTSSTIVKSFEIYVDSSLAFYSQIQTEGSGVQITEIDIVTSVSTASTEHRQIDIDVVPDVVSVEQVLNTTSVKFLQLYLDATLGFYSQVQAQPSGVQITEIDIVTSINTAGVIGREIELDVTPITINVESALSTNSYSPEIVLTKDIGPVFSTEFETDVNLFQAVTNSYSTALELELIPASINNSASPSGTEVVNRIESGSHDVSTAQSSSAELDIAQALQINNFNQFDVNNVTFADLNLYTLSSFPISRYSANSSSDIWDSYGTVKKNLKVTGTVTVSGNTVIGTGTSFDVDFGTDKFVIINGEKMKVTNVANSTYMTVNVNPSGTYTNVSAYQEVFV